MLSIVVFLFLFFLVGGGSMVPLVILLIRCISNNHFLTNDRIKLDLTNPAFINPDLHL
jgi:hypothetical protein